MARLGQVVYIGLGTCATRWVFGVGAGTSCWLSGATGDEHGQGYWRRSRAGVRRLSILYISNGRRSNPDLDLWLERTADYTGGGEEVSTELARETGGHRMGSLSPPSTSSLVTVGSYPLANRPALFVYQVPVEDSDEVNHLHIRCD